MARPTRDIALALLLAGVGLMVLFSSLGDQGGSFSSRVLYRVFGPVLSGVSSISRSLGDAWEHYVALTRVSKENERLRREKAEMSEKLTALTNLERENIRLRKLLSLKSGYRFPALAAQVIGEDVTGRYRSIFINRGSSEGVLKDMPVAVAQGLVGRILESSPGMAQALLIIDPALSVDCRVVRTRDRGILSGALDGDCILRHIDKTSTIRPSDKVITSGLDGVFPKGLLVGTVEQVRKSAGGLFIEANVRASVDFSKLEETLVILSKRGGFDIGPDTGRMN
jgi:rod shape-determining protein MreC